MKLSHCEEAIKLLICEVTKEEFEQFFEETFLKPLNTLLDNDVVINNVPTIPAETIRHKRQQTQHIKRILLTFKDK